MTKVTIGLPVYNAGSLLRECLESLRGQTYADFQAVIFDNCSSDDTAEIALHYASLDPRISYHRNEKNIGAWPNFAALLAASQTEYFLWRAYDDYTDPNFLEELVRLLDETPDADLAVGNITAIRLGSKPKTRRMTAPARPSHGLFGAYKTVKHARAAWIYGMWRTTVLQDRWKKVSACYDHAWGGDFMLMFETLYRGRVVGSTKTTFYQRIMQHAWKSGEQDLTGKLSQVLIYRQDARRYLESIASEFKTGWLHSLMFQHLSRWYVNRRIYSERKVRRLQAKTAGKA